MEYTVLLATDEDTVRAVIPDLPNVFVAGDSREDAIQRAREAIELYLSYQREEGEPIDEPTDYNEVVRVSVE